jgi:hypothetical protein
VLLRYVGPTGHLQTLVSKCTGPQQRLSWPLTDRPTGAHPAGPAGHTAAVKHVDWSSCSNVIQSACAGGELLHWDARSGKQLSLPQVRGGAGLAAAAARPASCSCSTGSSSQPALGPSCAAPAAAH